MKKELLLSLLNLFMVSCITDQNTKANTTMVSAVKYNVTDGIRGRFKGKINKPQMPEFWKNRFRQPFTPALMDYCDPYHCNDYHRSACGLNRKTMRFKWFQSICHLILHNKCARYRGSLKYDLIENKYCTMYVMYLRASCPSTCEMESLDLKCGISSIDNHAVLFKNMCSLDAANCREATSQEYEEVNLGVCEYYLKMT